MQEQEVVAPLPLGVLHTKVEHTEEVVVITAPIEPEQPNGLVLTIFLTFLLSCLAIWFATSRVHRAPLAPLQPLEADAAYAMTRVQHVHLVLASTSTAIAAEATAPLEAYAHSLPSLLSPHLPAGYSIATSCSVVPSPFPLQPPADASTVLYDVDDALLDLVHTLHPSNLTSSSSSSSSAIVLPPLTFLFLDAAVPTLPSSDRSRWYMGRHQHAYHFLSSLDSTSFPPTLPKLTALLTHLLSFHHTASSDSRRLPYHPSYRLSFTLLTSRPQPWTYTWDFDAITRDWLAPFLAATSPALSLSVDSQSLQFFDLAPASPTSRVVAQEELVDLVGRTGWMVASPLVQHSVELVAYIPERTRRPMTVRAKDGSEAHAFIVPGWGGLTIVNGVEEDGGAKRAEDGGSEEVVRDLDAAVVDGVMARLMALVRVMLGLADEVYPESLSSASASSFALLPSRACIAEWERTALFARFLSLSLQSALHDLRALVALVDTVPHMPVDDAIAERVQSSIDQAAIARQHCTDGRWQQCGEAALQCSTLAHDAFFAESLLPSLYFPEEHVYAVYAPLFVPIGLTVLKALLTRMREWRRRRRRRRRKGAAAPAAQVVRTNVVSIERKKEQ